MTIDEVLAKDEKQIFDRKSIQINPTDLSDTICAFANADGGTVAIGVFDKKRRIEGVDYHTEQLNEILRTPIDYCNPTVPVTTEMVECINYEGKPDHVLLMHIEASPLLHANQTDEAYLRVGDKSKKLSFQDRLTLMYAKGLRYFEDEPVYGATMEDIDLDFVKGYIRRIGYGKTAEDYLRENKNFITTQSGREQVSTAAILLFGKNPQQFFPRAFIRFIRYDGIEARVGKDMNVVKDVIFEGRILDQVQKAVDYIKTQMKEKTYLGHDGVFITEEEYSEFVRTEIVVNAATHRDYSITGTDIQIKMFDDRLEVDSPGTFAGMVKKENIRYTHFSRNPKIAAFLKDYGYVKEYGEGVERMCRELEAAGLPDPVFNNNTFILKTTVMSSAYEKSAVQRYKVGGLVEKSAVQEYKVGGLVEKSPVQERKVGGLVEKSAVQERKVGGLIEKSAVQKIAFSAIESRCVKKGYSRSTVENMKLLCDNLEVNQVFGAAYVRKVLECADSTARRLIGMLKTIDAVVPITGKGKGMYRLKYGSETGEE